MDKKFDPCKWRHKPQISKLYNETKILLHKEYENLRVIEYLVYWTAEDKDGYMRTQFERVTDQVIKQIHWSIYLGRRKTAA